MKFAHLMAALVSLITISACTPKMQAGSLESTAKLNEEAFSLPSKPTLTEQPQANTPSMTATSVQVTVGSDYLYIYMTATSGSAMTYEWYRNGVRVGGNQNNLWMNPVQSSDLGEYYVVVSNSNGSVTSQKVFVTARGESADGTTIPSAAQIIDSQGAVWTLSNGYSYRNGTQDGGPSIAQLLYKNRTVYANTNGYGWWAYNGGWQQTSNPGGPAVAVITAQPQANTPSITATSVQVTVGSDYLYIYMTATSDSTMTYEWYRNGARIGGNQNNLWVNPAQNADIGEYYVVVKNAGGSVASQKVFVTARGVATPPPEPTAVITAQPQANTPSMTATSVQVTVGSDYLYIYMTATSGSAMTYEWYRNGARIGGNQNDLWVNPAQNADIGEYYVVVKNAGGSVTSQKVFVTARSGTNPTGESADGTTIPSAAQIIDSQGVVWTLSNGYSYRNGTQDGGPGIVQLLYKNRTVYANTSGYGWWAYNGGWQQTSDPTGGSQPQPQPGLTLALGGCGSCEGGPQGITNVNNFASFLNKSMDYVLVWGWAPTAHDFEYSFQYLDELWPSSYKLNFSMPMIISGTTFADAYNGVYDSSYRTIAQRISSRDPNAIVRMGHEMNGNWYPWSMDGPAGSAEEFAMAFRHIVTVMRSVAPNLKFTWNPGLGAWAGLDAVRTYPGDAYVDYISLDMYEDSRYDHGTPTERWNNMLNKDGRGLTFWDNFASQHGKPLAFDEWASDYDDGLLISKMHEWMSTRNVAYQMYWNSNASFPGSFQDHPYNGQVYKELFGR